MGQIYRECRKCTPRHRVHPEAEQESIFKEIEDIWTVGEVIYRAGLSIVPVVPWEGPPPISCQFFYCFDV